MFCIRSDHVGRRSAEGTFIIDAAAADGAMSECQYYEFQAIDRPLDATDREALRALSTRARITATSFTNSYEWGNFKGDPAKLWTAGSTFTFT